MASAASLGNLVVRITANATDAENALARVKKGIAATFAIGAVDIFAHGVSAAVSNAFKLDKQLALLNTIATETFDPKRVRAFSDSINLNAIDATNALYMAFSSGAQSAAQAQDEVTQAQRLSITTGTDLQTSVKTIAGLVNAYGNASFTAADAAATVFEGFKDGVGSASDYANALGKVIPIGNQLGISAKEIAAEVAASTQTLKSAPAAATGLSQVYNELAKSTSYAGKLFKDSFGETFQQYIKKGHTGLEGIEKLLNKFGTNQVLDLFHAKGSGTAVNQLLTSFTALQKALKDQTVASQDFANAQDTVTKSASYQASALKNQALNALGSFGDTLKPIAEQWFPILSKWITDVTPKLEAFGNAASTAAAFLARHQEALKTVVEIIAIRFIPMLVNVGARLGVGLVSALANAGLAFLGFSTRVGVASAEVMAANTQMGVSTQELALKMESSAAAISLAYEGMSAKTIIALRGVGTAQGILTAETAASAASQSRSLAGIGTRAVGAAGNVAMALSLISLAWDKLGFKAVTGEGFIASAVDGIKYDVGKMGEGVLGTLGNTLNGFGLFSNGVGNALKNAGSASGQFADQVIYNIRQVDANIYDASGSIIQNLSAIQQQMLITMGALTKGSAVANAVANGSKLVQRGPGLQIESPEQLAAEQANKLSKDLYNNIQRSTPNLKQSGAALPGSDNGAKAKADKIKNALSDLSDLLTQLGHVSTMSQDQIDSLFKQIEKDTKDAGKKSLIPLEKSWNTKLDSMAKNLAAFHDKVQAELDFGKTVKQAVRDMGSVAQGTEGISTTMTGIINQQRAAIFQSQQFYAAFSKLKSLGLNDVSLSQLAQAGPAALASARALLSGGAVGVAQVNTNQKVLDKVANDLATKTADSYYNAGQSVSQGFLDGLKSKEKELEAQMDKLGAKLADRLRKSLGIHSPSRVMRGLGINVAEGLADGIISGSRKVQAASTSMTNSTIFGPGSVVVNHAPGDPARAGTLTGKGIASVLERQKMTRALGGVG